MKNSFNRRNFLQTSDVGITGNSHMPMMDTNNHQVADLILEWLVTTTN